MRVRWINIKKAIAPERYLRQDFGELARGRHDEALVGARPRDEVLDALVFEHAARAC